MPNGRPGDNPYTDILQWDAELYTEEVREHVRAVADYEDVGAIHRVSSLLWNTPTEARPEEVRELERRLRSVHEAIDAASDHPVDSPLTGCLEDDASVYTESIRELVREIHEQLYEAIDEKERGQRILSGILWEWGWEPDDLDELVAQLVEFRADHWIWDH